MYSVSTVGIEWKLEPGQEAKSDNKLEIRRAEKYGVARGVVIQRLDETSRLKVPLLKNAGGGIEFDGPPIVINEKDEIINLIAPSEIVLIG